jgi:hypothetical protein
MSKLISAGEYVVVVKDTSYSNSWENYCFKQFKDSRSVCPESTPKYPDNATEDHESYSCATEDWRYATPEEIDRYDREGMFKITSKPKKPKGPVNTNINNYQIY